MKERFLNAGRFRLLLAMLAVLFVVSRVPDLARQSPFVDELATWERALAGDTSRIHLLTFATLRTFLSFEAKSLFLLRLSSVLGWALAALLMMRTLHRLTGREGAAMGAVAMVFLPISQVFSQDANHYHWVAIAGAASLCAVEAATARRRCNVLEVLLFAVITGVCVLGHPVVVFVLAGMGLGILGGWAARPAGSPLFGRMPNERLRGLLVSLFLGTAAIGLLTLYREASRRAIQGSIGDGAFSLSPWYLLRLNTDLVGTTQFHHPVAVAGAAVLLALAVAGWVLALRRDRRRFAGVAIAAGLSVIVHVVFGGLFDYGHFFYARYFIGLLPWYILGWGFLAREASRLRVVSPLRKHAALSAAVLLIITGSLFAVPYHRGEYMAYGKALAWLDANATERDAVVTYKVYNSRGIAFWLRELDPVPRKWKFLPLDFAFERPWTFYQQLEDLKRGRVVPETGRVFYLHYQDGEEREEYNAFLERHTRIVAEFPSRAPDDLTPIRRDIQIREYLGLPDAPADESGYRFGADISSRYPRSRVGMLTLARRLPQLPAGSMVEYRGIARPEEGFLSVTISAEKTTPGEPVFLLGNDDLLGVFLLPRNPHASAMSITLALRSEQLPAGSEFSLVVLRPHDLWGIKYGIKSDSMIAVQTIQSADSAEGSLSSTTWIESSEEVSDGEFTVALLQVHPRGKLLGVEDLVLSTKIGEVHVHAPGDQSYSFLPVHVGLWPDLGVLGWKMEPRSVPFLQDPVLPGEGVAPRLRLYRQAP